MRTFALFGLAAAAYAAPAMTKDEGYQYYKVQVNSVVTGSAPLISELRLLGGESNQKLTPVDVQCATGNNEYCHGAITGGMAWNENCREAGFELGYGGQNKLEVKLASPQAVTDVQIWTSHIGSCRGANFELLGSADGAQWTSVKTFQVETCSCGSWTNVHVQDFQHCKVNWGEYGNCLASCGITTKERQGTVRLAPSGGGDACPALKQSAACKKHVCPCASGHFHNPMDCSACPAGRYQPDMGRNYCLACSGGKTQSKTGQSSCDNCDVGTYENESGSATADCKQCGLGQYNAVKGRQSCEKCPEGKFQPYYGRYDHAHCETCDAGTFSAPGAGECTACAKGQYGSKEGQRVCRVCPAGTFNKLTGKSALADCTPCPVGRYGAPGSVTCTQCPAGRFNEYSGGKTISQCTACAAGKASSDGAYACDKCAPGKYQAHNGENFCQDCACGTFNAAEGASDASVCTTCAAGTYSDSGAYQCTKCAAGFASSKGDQCNQSSCQICTKGSFALAGSTTCQTCAEGHYSASDGAGSCTKCDAGRFNAHKGATDVAGCKACAKGTFQNEAGQDSCYNCNGGAWAAAGATGCTKCVAGRSSAAANAGSIDTCVACGPGHFNSKEGANTCTACDRGTYRTNSGATAKGQCLRCAGNTFNKAAGAATCAPCADAWGASSCISCSAGTFQKFDGSKSCEQCASGTYKGDATHKACTTCPKGWFTQNMAGQSQCWEKPRDCETSAWGTWGTCSLGCGGGTQTRTRTQTQAGWTNPLLPNIPGTFCTASDLTESQPCNTDPCPIDCVTYSWGEWTECSKQCGGGSTQRTAGIRIAADHGGKTCLPSQLKETAQCNVHKCLSSGKCHEKHVSCSITEKKTHTRGKYGKQFEGTGEVYESYTMKVEHYRHDSTNDWGLAMTADSRATKKDSLTGSSFKCHRTSTALTGAHTCACYCQAHPTCGCQKQGWGIKGTALVGNVYTATQDAQSCCNLCTNHPLCQGWEFVGSQCSLKAGGELEQSSGNKIAGLRSGQVC
jgi:hypothetical protein